MSKIQVNDIVNHFDNGAPDCPRGLTIAGVSTISDALVIGGTDSTAKLNVFGGDIQIGTGLTFKSSSSIGNLNLQGGYTYPGGWIKLSGGSSDDNILFGTSSNNAIKEERLRLDSYGCVRVGNTHSQTTSGSTKRIALGAKASIWGWTSGQLDGNLTLADNYYWDGSNNIAIEADDAAYLSLRSGSLRFGNTDSTPSAGGVTGLYEKFRITSGGDVGINQVTPTSQSGRVLHISGNTGGQARIHLSTSASGHGADEGHYIVSQGAESGGVAGQLAFISMENRNFVFTTGTSGANATRLTIEHGGDLNIADGNLKVANGHGIDFSAAGNAGGMSSELLDDYEEGTWTAVLSSSGGGMAYTVDNTVGYYTKIGDVVHAWWYGGVMNITNNGIGSARLSGLPFNSANLTNNYGVVSTTHNTAFTPATDSGYVATNNDQIVFQPTGATSSSNWTQATGRYLMIHATYKAA